MTYANGTYLALIKKQRGKRPSNEFEVRSVMKKYITTLVMMAMLAMAVPMLSGTVEAQRNYRRTYQSRSYDYYGDYRRPNVYDTHRKAVNIGGGAAVGAILGALIGGGKGALIGAAVGAAGGAVVTSKQAPRNYYRYRY
jgi:outer membrane lipoprotein SlyB